MHLHSIQSQTIYGILIVMLAAVLCTGASTYAAPPAQRATPATQPHVTAREGITRQMGHEVVWQQLAQQTLPQIVTVYFPLTGHHVSNRAGFLDFWRSNGQVTTFGYPVTEEVIEDGQIVQYFERAKFEYHPDRLGTDAVIQLSLLGRELAPASAMGGVTAPQDGTRYYAETQHTLRGEFLSYWERRGATALFGYPITEELNEEGRTVQYFERAKFSYNPDDMAPFYRQMEQYNGITLNTLHEVELGDLGRQAAIRNGKNIKPVLPLPAAQEWSPGLWSRRIEVNLTTQWLTAYEDDLIVYRAPVATGRDGFNTPTGEFAIYQKLPIQTMVGSAVSESWYVPDVPWVQYVVGGVALHGTYWHDLFGTGTRMSHGCINLGMDDAQWLYEWADVGSVVLIFP